MSSIIRRTRRGLTLLEVMAAVVITLMMGVMIWETMSNSVEFNEALSMQDQTTRSARVALSRLRREIQLAFLTEHRAAIESYETVFVAEDNNPDTLYFATFAHQRLYRNSRESDQAEVTIWVDSGPDGRGEGDVLYHRESSRIDEEPAEGGRVYPLAYNVKEFNLRYLDPKTNEWLDEWDSRSGDTANRLPRSVEIALELIAVDPEDPDRTIEVPYLASVNVEYADRLTQSSLSNGGGQ
jgi:general secretion pathway protein J